MPSRIEFDVRFGPRSQSAPPRERGTPFRILICGDFSGRSTRTTAGDSRRPLLRLDLDTFDRAMQRMGARVALPGSDPSNAVGEISIESLDDFHPDALCRKVAAFEILCELRRRLLDPRTAAETIGALSEDASLAVAPETPSAAPTPPPEDQSDMFTRLLGERPAPPVAIPPPSGTTAAVDDIVRRAVAGHVAPAADPRQPHLVAAVERTLSESMRRLLHSPSFQRLEAAWRSLHWFVTTIGPDEEIEVYAIDMAKGELAADLMTAATPDDSGIHRLIMNAGPWSLIVGDYSFGTGDEDVALLAALGELARDGGSAFVGAAEDTLVGCRVPEDCSTPAAWVPATSTSLAAFRELRRSSAARFVGLTWPRWLLRAPYGAKRDAVESFGFEEVEGTPEHASLLWGNGAFVAAVMIASAFREGAEPDGGFEIGDLALYAFDEDGESRMQPCAECWLTEAAVEAALARGVVPLASIRGRNAVRVVRLQSIAEPAAALASPRE